MSILASDLIAFASATVSDNPATNGGRPAASPLSLNAKNNAFPDVGSAVIEAGGRAWRKLFLCNASTDNSAGTAARVLLDKPTSYGDYAYFLPGTMEDVESGISASAPIYGAALLSADAAAGATQITCALEDAALAPMFAAGRRIVLSTRSGYENTTSSVGVEETAEIASVSTSGTTATLTLTKGLANAYTVAAGARASVIYAPGTTIAPALTNWQESGSGTYDQSAIVLSNRGTIRQAWTIAYTSATSYTLTGDTLGLVGTYETTADAAPANPATYAGGAPYLTIPASGHVAGHAAGDTITFVTSPAAIPIWVSRVVPAGTTDMGMSDIPICWSIESE